MKSPVNQMHKRQRAELREEKYFVAYSDLWNEINSMLTIIERAKLDIAYGPGDIAAPIPPVMVLQVIELKLKEVVVCNDALWHMYTAEENALRNRQSRERRMQRRASAAD